MPNQTNTWKAQIFPLGIVCDFDYCHWLSDSCLTSRTLCILRYWIKMLSNETCVSWLAKLTWVFSVDSILLTSVVVLLGINKTRPIRSISIRDSKLTHCWPLNQTNIHSLQTFSTKVITQHRLKLCLCGSLHLTKWSISVTDTFFFQLAKANKQSKEEEDKREEALFA